MFTSTKNKLKGCLLSSLLMTSGLYAASLGGLKKGEYIAIAGDCAVFLPERAEMLILVVSNL